MRELDFDEFYLLSAHRPVQQLFPLTGDWAEAEDVVSEAFQRAWLRWDSLQGPPRRQLRTGQAPNCHQSTALAGCTCEDHASWIW